MRATKVKLIGHQGPIKIRHQSPTNNTHKKNIQELIFDSVSSREHTLVIKDENLRSGFAQVPNVILRDPLLSSNAVRLYCLLLSYAWDKNEAFPGKETLAWEMGCKIRTVTRTLAELKGHKLIIWHRQGLGKVNIYYIQRLSDGYFPKQVVDKGNNF